MSSNVTVRSGRVMDLLKNATAAPTTGSWIYKDAPKSAIQATVTGTGVISATVVIEASNDGVYPIDTELGTITLSGTTSFSDGFTTDAPWKYIRAVVSAISGTSAAVNVNFCI